MYKTEYTKSLCKRWTEYQKAIYITYDHFIVILNYDDSTSR